MTPFGDRAVTPFGDLAGPFGFDVPPPPDPGPPASYGPGGSFDFGPGAGSKQQKLARLRQLLDKGILTESEYQAQVRQVQADG